MLDKWSLIGGGCLQEVVAHGGSTVSGHVYSFLYVSFWSLLSKKRYYFNVRSLLSKGQYFQGVWDSLKRREILFLLSKDPTFGVGSGGGVFFGTLRWFVSVLASGFYKVTCSDFLCNLWSLYVSWSRWIAENLQILQVHYFKAKVVIFTVFWVWWFPNMLLIYHTFSRQYISKVKSKRKPLTWRQLFSNLKIIRREAFLTKRNVLVQPWRFLFPQSKSKPLNKNKKARFDGPFVFLSFW